MDFTVIATYALPPLEAAWVVGAAIYIVMQRRSSQATMAWVLALTFFPVFGILLYLMLGPRRFEKRKRRRRRAIVAIEQSATLDREYSNADPHAVQLGKMIRSVVGAAGAVRTANLEIFCEGKPAFDAIERAIDAATSHIHLEYYIWEPDQIGTRVRDRLIARAKAGVEVRVLVDGFGSSKAVDRFFLPLRQVGGRVRRFNELSLARWTPRMANFRTHRKIVVIDGKVGFTGGMNMTDVHTSEFSGEHAWRDTHVRLEGAAVAGLQRVFFEDWHYAGGDAPDVDKFLAPPSSFAEGEHRVQVVSSGPDENLHAIHKVFFAAIAGATRRVQLTTPYFVPDPAIEHALSVAALGGVDVQILVPTSGDVPLVSLAAESYYPELLEDGVEVYAYSDRVLHAKTLVVDDLAIIGTANTDNRSFRLNFEVALAVHDASIADQLSQAFERDRARAKRVTQNQLDERSWLRRLFSSTARLFSPVL